MINKFNVWLGGLLVLVVGVLLWGKSAAIICWDGLDVDEPLLEELCGINREEYFSAEFDPASCPESEQAVKMIGGCDTDWASVIVFTTWAGGAYLLVSGIAYGGWRLFHKTTPNSPKE